MSTFGEGDFGFSLQLFAGDETRLNMEAEFKEAQAQPDGLCGGCAEWQNRHRRDTKQLLQVLLKVSRYSGDRPCGLNSGSRSSLARRSTCKMQQDIYG